MNKNEIRKDALRLRKSISDKLSKSEMIVKRIMSLEVYKKSKVIAMYYSLPDEVSLNRLINNAIKDDKIVLLPQIKNSEMFFVKIDDLTIYKKSKFGVYEPVVTSNNKWQNNVDLILVPGVAFDINKNRIGYGKGYYDRFLKTSNAYKIGVCFASQILPALPIDNNDIPVDLIVNEKESF